MTLDILPPSYDKLAKEIVNSYYDEVLALTLNTNKKKIGPKDNGMNYIATSFMSDEYKVAFEKLIKNRFQRISTNFKK